MDIERKVFALTIWIWVGTLYQIQPEAPRSKHRCFLYLKWVIIKAHLSTDSNTASVPEHSTLVQLVHYTLSKF